MEKILDFQTIVGNPIALQGFTRPTGNPLTYDRAK